MAITTICPGCKALFRLPEELAGKTVQCQKCATLFVVPTDTGATAQVAMPQVAMPQVAMPQVAMPQVAMPVASEPPTPAPASEAPMAAVLAPPPIMLQPAPTEDEHVQDGPSKPPPISERPMPRRLERDRAPVKSGSGALPFVLVGLGVMLFLCLGCTGVGAVWWAVSSDAKAKKKNGLVKLKDKDIAKKDGVGPKKDDRFEPWKDMKDRNKDVAKFDRVKVDGVKIPDVKFAPVAAPPGGIPIVFGPDNRYRSDNVLNFQDPLKLNKYVKVYSLPIEKGKAYEIDMISNQLDSYLRLLDDAGQTIREDDDSGGGLNSLIIYEADRTAVFRIEATSFGGQQTGNFSLLVLRR